MSRNDSPPLLVGIVDIGATSGGVRTFIDSLEKALNTYGTNLKADKVHFEQASDTDLKKYDVLHFSHYLPQNVGRTYVYDPRHIFKDTWRFYRTLRSAKGARKVLTIHGWITKEARNNWKLHPLSPAATYYLIAVHIGWAAFRLFFMRQFDIITTPTLNTARENNLQNDSVVLTNAVFTDSYPKNPKKDVSSATISLCTYASGGGDKQLQTIQLIDAISHIAAPPTLSLTIYGTLPKNIQLPENVHFAGFVKHFYTAVSQHDFFITLKDFPDFGYVEMETALAKCCIIKLNSQKEEEIVHLASGYLLEKPVTSAAIAQAIHEIVDGDLYDTLTANNFEYVQKNKNWVTVALEWQRLYLSVPTTEKSRR
jgi:glycosyltransferase involved in cell wall biosynthesis